jgi:hypothetical protein
MDLLETVVPVEDSLVEIMLTMDCVVFSSSSPLLGYNLHG